MNIQSCTTRKLRDLIGEHGQRLKTRKECLNYLQDNGYVPDKPRRDTKPSSFARSSSHTTDFSHTSTFRCIQQRGVHDNEFIDASQSHLYAKTGGDESKFSNVYVNGDLNVHNELKLKGVYLDASLQETVNRVHDIRSLISSSQSQINALVDSLDVYMGVVNHQFTYIPTPSEVTPAIQVLEPAIQETFIPYRFEQHVAIDDNIVNWFVRFRFDGQGSGLLIPKDLTVELPYPVLTTLSEQEIGHTIPVRSFVLYETLNRFGNLEMFNIKPRISHIETVTNTNLIRITHDKIGGCSFCEFHINARYKTDVYSFNLNYMSPFRFDMMNERVLLPTDFKMASIYEFYYGKSRWTFLQHRVDVIYNVELWIKRNPSVDETIIKIVLPFESERYMESSHGEGYVYIDNSYKNANPVIWINPVDPMYVNVDLRESSLFENLTSVSLNTPISLNFHIIYNQNTTRRLDLDPIQLNLNMVATYDTLTITDFFYRNSKNYDTGELLVNKTNDMMIVSRKTNATDRSFSSFIVNRLSVNIKPLLMLNTVLLRILHVSDVIYYPSYTTYIKTKHIYDIIGHVTHMENTYTHQTSVRGVPYRMNSISRFDECMIRVHDLKTKYVITRLSAIKKHTHYTHVHVPKPDLKIVKMNNHVLIHTTQCARICVRKIIC